MVDSRAPVRPTVKQGSGRSLLWLLFACVVVMLVADWFYGSFTRDLVLRQVLGQASIEVSSEPPGARVLVDTLELGTTPLTASRVLPGTYVLRVEHPHFEPVRETLTLARGDEISRRLELLRGVGTLELVSNPRSASIRLNGELQEDQTPVTLADIAAGVYEVELSLPGRRTVARSLDLQRNQTVEFSADLERIPTGILSVDVAPADARVELVGSTLPYTPDMALPLDDYVVRVSSPGFVAEEQQVSVRRGPNRLHFELQQLFGELSVSVTPASARVTVQAEGSQQRYSAPLLLPVGKVRVSASQLGYRTANRSIELGTDGASVNLQLSRLM